MNRFALFAFVALGACASTDLRSNLVAGLECDPPSGWEAAADAANGGYLVVGETHGSTETPAAFAELVCAVAKRGDRVLVALELSSAHDGDLQSAWTGTDEALDSAILATFEGRQDGVGSEAMANMIKRLRALKNAGASIDVAAFNPTFEQSSAFAGGKGQEPHEMAQAANISAARSGHDLTAVLVGSFHARKTAPSADTPSPVAGVRPMAMHLDGGPAVSLVAIHDGGETWSCQPKPGVMPKPGEPITADMIDCSAHPMVPTAQTSWTDVAAPVSVSLAPAQSGAYDGYLNVGPLTASPPFAGAQE